MNFQPGDQIVHRHFGVGKIKSIEGMNFTGNEPRLFYHVEFSKTTVWVPVGNQPAGGLRPITQKNQLYRYRAILKSSPAERNNDFSSRNNRLENLMKFGTLQGLCEVIRDLNAWKQLKPLSQHETALLKQAQETLAAEWSAASGFSLDEALEEIDGYLSISGQRYALEEV
jgi:RNA polymerase-interacting CarD/CdnL/TRCF family regulator